MIDLNTPYIPSVKARCQINKWTGFSNDYKNKLPQVMFYNQWVFCFEQPVIPHYEDYITDQVSKYGREYEPNKVEEELYAGIKEWEITHFNEEIEKLQNTLNSYWPKKDNKELLSKLTQEVEAFLECFFPRSNPQAQVQKWADMVHDLIW